MDLADICRIVHPTRVMNTPTSVPCGTFFRRDQMQGHKTGLSNSQNTEAILNMFSDCSGIKPEVNKRETEERRDQLDEGRVFKVCFLLELIPKIYRRFKKKPYQ